MTRSPSIPDGQSDGPRRRPNPDRIVNRILDAESEGAARDARRLGEAGRKIDASFDARLARTRRVVGELSLLPESPDLSHAVLDEVGRCRGFVARRARRRFSAGRIAMLCGAVGAFACAMIVHRVLPQFSPLPAGPAPVSQFVDAGRADFTASVRSLGEAFGAMQDGLTQSSPAPSRGLSLGDTRAYDTGVRFDASYALAPAAEPDIPVVPSMRVVRSGETVPRFPFPLASAGRPVDAFGRPVFPAPAAATWRVRWPQRLDDPNSWLDESLEAAPR